MGLSAADLSVYLNLDEWYEREREAAQERVPEQGCALGPICACSMATFLAISMPEPN